MGKKQRLDEVLLKNGFVTATKDAFIVVTEGRVLVNGQKAISPAQLVSDNDQIEVRGGREYVGRGAYKLGAALEKFGIDVAGKICADIGSATGGFVEVLLRRGAEKVYAIDTARGKLALKLREDPRVMVMEGTDVRDITELPEKVELVSIDVSLISLRDIVLAARRLLAGDGIVIALFKPQYETRDPAILRHGIVKDDAARQVLLEDFIAWAEKNGWEITKWIESPIRGSEGNVEYLLHAKAI